MAVRIFPNIVAGAAGGVDGLLHRSDVDNGRVSQMKQYSTWAEAAYFLGGAALSLMRFSDDITEPLMYSGAALLARRAALATQTAYTTPPVVAQAMARYAQPAIIAGRGYVVDQGAVKVAPAGVYG